MGLLHRQLMQPDWLGTFLAEFTSQWEAIAAELRAASAAAAKGRASLDRKIANLVDAIADGRASPAILSKLAALEAERDSLPKPVEPGAAQAPVLGPRLGAAYAANIASLTNRLRAGDDPEGLEIARSLGDRVTIHPP